MKLRNLYPGSWGSNCYLLMSGTHALVVDPSATAGVILTALREEGVKPEAILLTHGHFDHIISLDALRDAADIPAMIHIYDRNMPGNSHQNAFYNVFRMERNYRLPERVFTDGEEIPLGDETVRVIHTPGHTAGSVCFLCNDEFILTGDTLFADSYGRTDLYSGDESALRDSIEKLRKLPKDLPIYPGHGDPAILGHALDNLFF